MNAAVEEVFAGQCQCCELRYRVTGESLTLFACHCYECQRQTASAFGMAFWVKVSKLEVVSGRLQSWQRALSSGRVMHCDFCPSCGSRIFHRLGEQEEIISIKPGTLTPPISMKPVAHIWTSSGQSWISLDADCLIFPENPPNFDAHFEAWKKRRGS